MPKLKVVLITGRSIGQGQGKEYGKFSEKYKENVAVCEIDSSDLSKIGISTGQNVKVTTFHGSVVVKGIKSTQEPHPEIIFIPCGPWANAVICPKTHGTGMPSLKGIPAEIEPAPEEKILALQELVTQTLRKG